MSWRKIARKLWPKDRRSDRNIHLSARNPHTTAAGVAAGAEKFRSQCVVCHSAAGQAGIGAALAKSKYKYGLIELAI